MGLDMRNSKLYAAGGPIPASQPVKRALFGHVDHQQSLAFLENETRIYLEEQKAKWNFDFVEERPLSGPYAWEPVAQVPSVYVPISVIPPKKSIPKVTKVIRPKKSPAKNAVNRALRNLAEQREKKQSSITDFMSKMKGGMKKPPASE